MPSKLRQRYRDLRSSRWNIALCDTDVEALLNGAPMELRWLQHDDTGSWFADPFILDADSKEIHFLVEEFVYSTRLGRISHLVADRRTMRLKDIRPVLEQNFHLSFPAIMRRDDGLYIYPECGHSGKLILYRYDPAADSCSEAETIIEAPLADATIADIYGRRIMLATSLPDPNGSHLEIYGFDGVTPELIQTVDFDRNIARNAGAPFYLGDRCFRPAQETVDGLYGAAVVLQEIGLGDKGEFTFTDRARFTSPLPELAYGFHTFNVYKGLTVVDAKGFRYPVAARIINALRSVVK